jgi:hypothetical protein
MGVNEFGSILAHGHTVREVIMARKKQTMAQDSRQTTVAFFVGPSKSIEALLDIVAALGWM